jgi:TPR repeat protein
MKRIVLLCLTVAALSAADPSWTDWRELWYPDRCARWDSKSQQQLRDEARSGNAVAMYVLSKRLRAEHTSAATKEANEWMYKAAAAGLPQAVIWVEIKNNSDEPEEVKHRLAIYEKLALTGCPDAQIGLAGLLFHGGPLKPELPRALALVRSAYAERSINAYYHLAMLYARGIGEPRNSDETPTKLLIKAASYGHIPAVEALVERYHLGFGVEKDGLLEAGYFARVKAYHQTPRFDEIVRNSSVETRELLELFRRGLLERRPRDLIKLAEMHQAGTGGKSNLVRAAALFTLANATDRAEAVKKTLDDRQKQQVQDDVAWLAPELNH